jgi:hypothetical protein
MMLDREEIYTLSSIEIAEQICVPISRQGHLEEK